MSFLSHGTPYQYLGNFLFVLAEFNVLRKMKSPRNRNIVLLFCSRWLNALEVRNSLWSSTFILSHGTPFLSHGTLNCAESKCCIHKTNILIIIKWFYKPLHAFWILFRPFCKQAWRKRFYKNYDHMSHCSHLKHEALCASKKQRIVYYISFLLFFYSIMFLSWS